MSIVRWREGSDVTDKNFKRVSDTFNFFNGKLVSWERNQDGKFIVFDPDTKGFDKVGVDILSEAEIITAKILKAGPKPK
jgi:hypothetical protein